MLTFLLALLFCTGAARGESVIGDAVRVEYDASAQSSALTAPAGGIQKYRLVASTSIHYLVGADPTATSLGTFLPANVIDYVLIPSGHKIAAIKASGANAGFLTINKVK